MKTAVRGLAELARLYGIEPSYEGLDGIRRTADVDAVMLVLRALGAQLGDNGDPRRALEARRAELDALQIQPVHVAWEGVMPSVRVRLPHREPTRAAIELRLESGAVISHETLAEPVARRPRAGWTATHRLHFDRRIPLGYHRLVVETSGSTFDSLIIAAPRHAHTSPDAREWGVFIPLYAIRTRDDWGTGTYTDLAHLAQWIGKLNGSFIATLPMLATFLDVPFDPSPYSPVSRLFWNSLFIDVTSVPGWTPPPDHDLDEELRALRSSDHVDYARVAAIKRRELTRAVVQSRSDDDIAAALEHFAAAHPHAADYARFRAACDRFRTPWPSWPEPQRSGRIEPGDVETLDYEFHLFAQWQAEQQLAGVDAARAHGAAKLYIDMPLGVHPHGYDAWRFRDIFVNGVCAGAPPDPLFTGGQDWGFRPLSPFALRASGYAYFIETLRHHFRHAPMVRLDHVMALYRLFWVPDGLSATRGVYVRYPEDELFAILLLESTRHNAVVVGEDLGTVPPAVRRAMDRHHVHRMHVVQYDAATGDESITPSDANVVASLNTHDMPLFAGFWRGSELEDQYDLGLISRDELEVARAERARLRQRLSRAVGAGGEISAALVRQRLLERLGASPAHYVLVTLEDLWDEDRPQNVPGTGQERPNWLRRAARTLDEIMSDASIRRMLNGIHESRTASKPDNAYDA